MAPEVCFGALGFRYRLEPWRPEHIFRDSIEYGPRLVRAAPSSPGSAMMSFGLSDMFYPRYSLTVARLQRAHAAFIAVVIIYECNTGAGFLLIKQL